MIQLTEDMYDAAQDEIGYLMVTDSIRSDFRKALEALLAIVERDNQVHPLCTATLGTDMRCEFEAGMAHPDEHSAKAPSGSRVRWS